MGQRDLAQSDYFNNPARFADACNGILFAGKQLVKVEELTPVNSELVFLQNSEYRKVIPDKVMLWRGIHIAILTLENQTKIDYSMVFRVMKSEALAYEQQWKERAQQRLDEKKISYKQELSWCGKDERFIPVITIVIYFGRDEQWDGARCLYDMLEMDEEIEPYITNFRINLYDFHEHDDFSEFGTENRKLFEFLSCGSDLEKMSRIMEQDIHYRNLDIDVARTMVAIMGADIKLEEAMETVNMSKAWAEWRKLGELDGQLELVQNALRNGHTPEEITAFLGVEFELVKKAEEALCRLV